MMADEAEIAAALGEKKKAYALTFGSRNPAAQFVLADLVNFCHWGMTTFAPDQRETDVMIGRQQVILHMLQYLNLTGEQLFAMFYGKPAPSKRRARYVEDEDD